MMTVYKFKRRLENQNADAMVEVNSIEHGFIWYGRVKFMSGHFRNEFFDKKIVSMKQDRRYISITV